MRSQKITRTLFSLFWNTVLISLLFISSLALFATLQTSYIWGDVYFEQILIALYEGAPGAGDTIIQRYILFSFIPAIILTLVLSCFVNKKYVLLLLSVSVIVFSLYKIRFIDYMINSNIYSDVYKLYYKNPNDIKFQFPQKKKNLIIIYMESIEKDYTDLNIYNKNLLPKLSALSKQGTTFDGYVPLPTQNYTIAALVGGFCSVPYKFNKAANYTELRNFLPNLTCYSDILKQNGYTNYLFKSTDLRFAQMGIFFKTHGFDNVYDIYDMEQMFGYDIKNNKGTSWGYRDSIYYEIAKQQLTKIATSSDKPFMFTMITLDTHHPDIYLDENCKKSDNYAYDIILCADSMAANFVKWIQKQDFYKDSVIVILGDHIATDKTRILYMNKPRQIFNLILNADIKQSKSNRLWTVLDIAPTVLNAIGIKFEDGKFGLGRSLYADKPTIYETINKNLFTELLKSSHEYENFKTLTHTFDAQYNLYSNWGTSIDNIQSIKKYASFYDILFSYLWLDTLAFTLPEKPKSNIIFEIDFRIMFMQNKQRTIQFFVNDEKVTEITYKQNTKQPIKQQIIIPADLIKDDKKLKIEFRGNDLGKSPSTVGIAVLGFSLHKTLN